MKRILLFLVFGFTTSIVYAQTDAVSQATYDKILDENEGLQDKLLELESKYQHVLDSLAQRNRTVSDGKRYGLETLYGQISELIRANNQLRHNIAAKRNQFANMQDSIGWMDKENSNTVSDVEKRNNLLVQAFRGAIYYPIRSRYSPVLVEEALKLGPVFSEDEGLKKNYNDYRPMLEKYRIYSEDLVNCLKGCENIAKEFNAKFGKRTKDGVRKHAESQASSEIMNKLTSSLYYKDVYVKVKANPNAISIPYLNNIIKEFEANQSKINYRVYAGFIDRLEAKD